MTLTPSLTRLTRFALVGIATLSLASACGGSSFGSGGGEGAESGSGNTGGSNGKAGSTGTAGKAHAGSSSSGGSATAGTSSGGSGTAGSGTAGTGPGGEACNAPAQTGNCDAYFQRWYHDPSSGLCRPFVYGGCGGNANNYETLEACQQACPGGSPDYDACTMPTDCAIGGLGCCGLCDGPGISEHDLIAFNGKYREQVYAQCALTDIACAPCLEPGPGQGTLQYFVPNCVQGQCVAQDIRTSAVTACKTEADCRLRSGTSCCPSCGGDDYVAVRNDGSFEKLVCGNLLPPCAACEPLPPEDVVAVCDGGHCSVAYLAATN